jgi:protein TonB
MFSFCVSAQETKTISTKRTIPNYTISEKYSVLKGNPNIKQGSYSASIASYTEKGQFEQGVKSGVWECFKNGKLVQKYDFSSQSFLLGAETIMIKDLEQLDEQGNVIKKLNPTSVYLGGDEKILSVMVKSVRYPSDAFQNNIQGRVLIEAVINKDGKVLTERAVTNFGYGLEQEALRVFRSLPPDWVPTFVDGKAVNVKITMNMTFTLSHLPPLKD